MTRFILPFIIAFFAFASSVQADVIETRKQHFRNNNTAIKAIRKAIMDDDLNAVALNADIIAAWSSRLTEFFPEDSGTGKTDARAEIWTNWQGFVAAAAEAEDAAMRLAALARQGETGAMNENFKTLAATCKSCHSRFKN
jgi:cytochrome c556